MRHNNQIHPYSPQFVRKRQSLLALPLLTLPFLFFAFYLMGGGKGKDPKPGAEIAGSFNTTLPSPKNDPRKTIENKADYYRQADQDSVKRNTYLRQDPYRDRISDTNRTVNPAQHMLPPEDPRAAQLIQQLNQLQRNLQQPAPPLPAKAQRPNPPAFRRLERPLDPMPAEREEKDTQLEKLNGMLDKIIRIQHADQDGTEKRANEETHGSTAALPDTMAANSLPAVVESNQTLVAGGTIALRLEAAARIGGVLVPKDQLVYGVASISNDRMLITINSIRKDRSIYSTGLQVYDMDGLPGIHIPGDLGRETAKESADQAIGTMNLNNLDPSIGAQAANAGIVTARTLLRRRVRTVRVSIRAGYQVLLRNNRAAGSLQMVSETKKDSLSMPGNCIDCLPFMNKATGDGKMLLQLTGIYLQDNSLYFMLVLKNGGPIAFVPDHIRWSIRDRHQERRTAIQDLELSPVYENAPERIPGDSSRTMMAAFVPFALPKDKELVLLVAERNGARVLQLHIDHKNILHARNH